MTEQALCSTMPFTQLNGSKNINKQKAKSNWKQKSKAFDHRIEDDQMMEWRLLFWFERFCCIFDSWTLIMSETEKLAHNPIQLLNKESSTVTRTLSIRNWSIKNRLSRLRFSKLSTVHKFCTIWLIKYNRSLPFSHLIRFVHENPSIGTIDLQGGLVKNLQ